MVSCQVADAGAIPAPPPLVCREAVAGDIRRICEFLGGCGRLRAHVKTHKMPRAAPTRMAAGIGTFLPAALLLSTVISTAGPDPFTFDAGAKSIAPDTPAPHFRFLDFTDDLKFVRRNEEHQLLRLPPGTNRLNVGDQSYLLPGHVCTTNLWAKPA